MKKKTNRINRTLLIGMVVLGATIVSLLASCKKEDKPNAHANLNLDGISFTACIEKGDPTAKTYLDGQDIKWMDEDLILVQNSASQQAPFQVVEGINTMNGTFYTGSTFNRSPDYDAAYPYSMVTLSGTTATFTLPQQQHMTVTGTFGNGTMPMVAHATSNVLNFYNVCGGICFPLKGEGKQVTKIVLTSKDSSDKLWGTFTASTTATPVTGNVTSGPMPTYVSGGSNSVELICDNTITLTAEPQQFYIMVPPQTMKSGFTMTAYNGTTSIYSRDITWDAATHANFITRSVVSEVQTPITIADPLAVTTISPTFISQTQAYGQGTVTGEADNITERGVCWALGSVTTTPTLANSYKAEGGTATGSFALMFGDTNPMTKDCVYYVRAYAKNASGVAYYGDPIPFATRKDYSNDYNGRMPYAFSVADGRQVNFSMGNLQYKASTNTWRFAEYQFEYVGGTDGYRYGNVYANGEHPDASQNGAASGNQNISSSYDGWIDLFSWATSGYHNSSDLYNVNYHPYSWSKDKVNTDYNEFGYGPSYNMPDYMSLTGANANYDWGVYNNISNDGSFGTGAWRTLTANNGEWDYLLYSRSASTINGTANTRYASAQINARFGGRTNTVSGFMVFPDTYTWPAEVAYYPAEFNSLSSTFENGHQWTEAEWSLLEKNGAIFMPAGGYRDVSSAGNPILQYPSQMAMYWSVTRKAYDGIEYRLNAYMVVFGNGYNTIPAVVHWQGFSVRLVRNVN